MTVDMDLPTLGSAAWLACIAALGFFAFIGLASTGLWLLDLILRTPPDVDAARSQDAAIDGIFHEHDYRAAGAIDDGRYYYRCRCGETLDPVPIADAIAASMPLGSIPIPTAPPLEIPWLDVPPMPPLPELRLPAGVMPPPALLELDAAYAAAMLYDDLRVPPYIQLEDPHGDSQAPPSR